MDSQSTFLSRIGQMFWGFLGYVTSAVQRYLTPAPPNTGNDDTNISPEARVCEEKNSDKEEEDNYLREETKRESKCWSHVDTADERVVNLMQREIFLSNQMESMSEQCMPVYVTSTEKEQVNQHPEKEVLEEADDAQDKGDVTQDIIKLGVEVEDTYIFANEQENKKQDEKTTEDESHKSVDQRTEKKIELVEGTDVRLPGDEYPFREEDESKCEIKKERKNARKYEDLIQSNEVSIFRGHTEEHHVTEKVIGDSGVKEVVMTREDMMRHSNGKTEPVAGETPFEEDKVLLSDTIDTQEIEPGETADGVEAGGAGQGSYEENERSTEETMEIESITKSSMGLLERGSKGEEMRGEWQGVQKSLRLETKKKSYKKDLAGANEKDISYLYELGREDRLGEEDGEECARIQPVQKEKMDNRKKAEKEEQSCEEKQEAKLEGEFGSGMYGSFETAIKKLDVSMENRESDKVGQEEEKREAEQNETAEMGVQERLQAMEIEIKYETIMAEEGQDESRKTQMAGQDKVQREEESGEVDEDETQRNEKSKDEEILPESVLTLNMGQYERTEQQVEEEGDVDKLRDELDEENKNQGSMTEDRDESDVFEESGEDGERERCLFELEKEGSNIYEGMREPEILHEEKWREESKINEEVAALWVDVGNFVEANKEAAEENKDISRTEWKDDINHEREMYKEKKREERSSNVESAGAEVSMKDGKSDQLSEEEENRGAEQNEIVEMEVQEKLLLMEPEIKHETFMTGEGEEEMSKTQRAGQPEMQGQTQGNEVKLLEMVITLNTGQSEEEKEEVKEEGDMDKLRDELDKEDHNQGPVTEKIEESDVIAEGVEDGERETCLSESEKEENNASAGMRDTEILHEERWREESKINEEVAASGIDVGESVEANKEAAEENKDLSGTEWKNDINHEGKEYKKAEREERSSEEKPAGAEVSMENGESDKVQEEKENRGAELNEKVEIAVQEREKESVEEEGDVDKLRDELDEEDKSQGSVTEDRDESDVIEQSGEDGERERCLSESEKEENYASAGMRDQEILYEERWREESKMNEEVAASWVDVGEYVAANKKGAEENKVISGTEWKDDIKHEGDVYKEKEKERQERSPKEEPTGVEASMEDGELDKVQEEEENRGAELNEKVEIEVQEREKERVEEEEDVDKLRDELDEEDKSQGSVTEDRDESDVIEEDGDDGEKERCLSESKNEENDASAGMRDIEILHEERWREESKINEEVAASGIDVGESVEANKKVSEENKEISGTEWKDDINHEGEEYKEREREERSSKEEPAGAEVSMKDGKSDQVREEKENRGVEKNEVVVGEVQEKLLLMEPEIKDETIMAEEGEEEMRKTQVAGQDEFQREEESTEVEENAKQGYEKSKDEVILPEDVFTLNMGQFETDKERAEEEGDVDKLRDELDEENKNQGSVTENIEESDVIAEGVEDGERETCLSESEKEENNASTGMRDPEILHEERWREESKINEEVAASWVDVGESVVVEEGDVDKLRDELDEENKNQGSVTEDRDEIGVIEDSREYGERERCLFELEKEENNDSEGMRDMEILHEERWREESKIIEEVAASWIDVGESETCEVNVQNLREEKNLEISVTELRDDRKHRENVYEVKEQEIFDIPTEEQPYENINIFHEALDMSKENETKSDLEQTEEPRIHEDNIFGRNSHVIDLFKVAEEQETKKEERDNECLEKQPSVLIVGETKDEGHVSDENVDIKTMEEGGGMDFNVAPATKSELIEGFSANIVTEGITLRDGWAIEKTEETINNDGSQSGDTPYAVDRGGIRRAETGRDINQCTMSTTEGQRPKIQLKIEKGVKLEEDEIFTKAKEIQSQFTDAKLHKTSEHGKLLAETTGQSRTRIVNEETDGNEGRKQITKDGAGKKRIRKRTHENEEEEFNLQLDSPSLDFTAQKSRIALKNRHVRAPKDPRILLQIPSLSPTSAPPTLDEEAVTKPVGIKVGGVEMMRFKLPGIGTGFPVLKKTERRVEERGEESTEQMTMKTPTPNLGPEDREPAATKKWAAGSVGVKLPGFGPGMPALRKTDKGVKLIEKTTDDATVPPGKCDTSSGGGAGKNGEESKEKGVKSVGPSTIKLPSFGAGFPVLRKTERGSKLRGEEGKTSEAERNETENNQPEKPGSDSPMLVSELKKRFMKTERK